jgi:hypothetical protein
MLIYVVEGTAASGWLWHTLAMSCEQPDKNVEKEDSKVESASDDTAPPENVPAKEVGGRGGLDPTRYGDWEKAGRCIDF